MEAKHKAAQIQQDRELADLANHRQRVVWLSKESPRYSCGTPVDAHTKHALLLQSRAAINQATKQGE